MGTVARNLFLKPVTKGLKRGSSISLYGFVTGALFTKCNRIFVVSSNALLHQSSLTKKVIVVEQEEEVQKKKAAGSHLTPSIFHDELLDKFVNCMMWDGKKSVSQRILRDAFEEVKRIQLQKRRNSSANEHVEVNPIIIFREGIENCKPILGLQTLRQGTRTYKVPMPLPDSRRRFQAIRWILDVCRNKKVPPDTKMYKKLAKEFIDAYNGEGEVIQKKKDFHRTVEANRAFAHYRWW